MHTSYLPPEDVTTREGAVVTTVERTIADVARSGLPNDLVLQAIDQAIERGLTTPARIRRFVDARGGRAKRLVDRALIRESP
jgi:hypothetical protein